MIHNLRYIWNWWIGQLSDALPTLSTARKRAAIVAYPQDLSLRLQEREAPHADLGTLHFHGTRANHQQTLAKIASVTPGNRRVVLRLPEGSGVRRLLSLPQAAEAHLSAIAENELDRMTPWRPDQAIFSAKLTSTSLTDGTIDVEINAVPHFAFVAAGQCLRENTLELIGVLLEHAERAPDFIAVEPDAKIASSPSRRRKAIVAILALAASLAFAAALGQKLWIIQDLEAHMLDLKADADKVQQMQDDLQKLTLSTYYAVNVKRAHPSAIVTMEVLSRTLPDDCWLDALSMSGDQVTLEGHATDALALLPLLTASGFFQDVHFNSEVMRDVDAGIEGFSITATVIPHAAP